MTVFTTVGFGVRLSLSVSYVIPHDEMFPHYAGITQVGTQNRTQSRVFCFFVTSTGAA